MEIDASKCKKCGLCLKVCLPQVIDLEKAQIHRGCIYCGHCMAVCPHDAILSDGKMGEKIQEANINSDNFRNLLYNRRSHRSFVEKEISEEILQDMVDVLRYSPTGHNTQKVYMSVITGKKNIKKLSDDIYQTFQAKLSKINSFTAPFLGLFLGKKLIRKLRKLKKFFLRYEQGEDIFCYNAPCVFIFHAPKSVTPSMDCNIWASFASLHAETYGLGTCFHGYLCFAFDKNTKLKKEWKIPPTHKVYSAFLMGYPKTKFIRKVVRQEPKVTWIS